METYPPFYVYYSEEERQRRRENMIRINKERKGQNTTLNKKRDDKGRFLSK